MVCYKLYRATNIVELQKRMLKDEKEMLLSKRIGEQEADTGSWENKLKEQTAERRISVEDNRLRASLGGYEKNPSDWRREQLSPTGSDKSYGRALGYTGTRDDKKYEFDTRRRESETIQRNLDKLTTSSKDLKDKLKGLQGSYASYGSGSYK